MRRFLIVGAGGFGRELLDWVKDPRPGGDEAVTGFLDDNPHALDGYGVPVGIVDSIADYEPRPDDLLVMAIGQVRPKLSIAATLLERGARFATVLHPTAGVGRGVELGVGCVMCPESRVTCDARIGDFVAFNVSAGAGHDTTIGDGCMLNAHSTIEGFASLGRGVFMGSHACVLPRVRVGDWATIGAGSAVVANVKPLTTVLGVPARRLAVPQRPPV